MRALITTALILFSIPQLSMDCFFKFTGAELELMSDQDMFLETESGLRGGVSFVRNRYACSSEDEQLLHMDANNLYGMDLALPLCTGGYKRLSEEEFSWIDWTAQTLNQPTGYMACVDLSVPKELHEKMEDFPLAPDRMDITYKDLSPYARAALKSYTDHPTDYKTKKLVGSFADKKRYYVHYMNLKLFLEEGVKIDKIHSVTSFNQARVFQPYIEKTMELRRNSKSAFKSAIWKKM